MQEYQFIQLSKKSTMKNRSSSPVMSLIALAIIVFSFMRCNSSTTESDTTKAAETEIAATTEVTTPPMDTPTPAIDSSTIAEPKATTTVAPAPKPEEKAAPTKTSATKQTPTTKAPKSSEKASAATPAPNVEKKAAPVVEQPKAKEPEVATKPSTPEPKPEKKAATPPPSTVSMADFTYKTTKAVIHGTSTLHDWDSQVTKVEGKGSFQTKDDALVALKDVEIKIEVKGIKSKEGKKMDDKTFETLKSDKNPFITYTFSNAQVKTDASNAVSIEAAGNLSIAGVSKPVTLTATGKLLPNGDLQLTVSKKIKMTDYKMEPPVMMLGTIKVGNEVTVSFDFVLSKSK
jgi:polyisoprenoid-binding protein YceI